MKKVLIIGLGNIGFKYDLNLNKDHYIYTHSRAFNSSSLFDVVGAVETDPKVRKKFSEIYPIETFTSLEEASNSSFAKRDKSCMSLLFTSISI